MVLQTTIMFSKKTVCIITGASRGLGRSISLNFSKEFTKDSVFILLARNENLLSEVKQIITQKCVYRCFDQATGDQKVFDSLLPSCLEEMQVKADEFQQACIIHNAGSLECEMTEDLIPVQRISNYYNANVTGVVVLNASFLRLFKNVAQKVVVNISSLAAIQPVKSWALYCSSKAARDMYFKVLASEHPTIRVLNYAPGPLLTDMVTKTALLDTKDEEMRNSFKEMISKNTILSCNTSVLKFIQILKADTFENAAHVDFYD